MTKGEEQTIRNIIARLRKPRLGSASLPELNDDQTLYVETWLIGPLELLLPETRDVRLAESMSKQ